MIIPSIPELDEPHSPTIPDGSDVCSPVFLLNTQTSGLFSTQSVLISSPCHCLLTDWRAWGFAASDTEAYLTHPLWEMVPCGPHHSGGPSELPFAPAYSGSHVHSHSIYRLWMCFPSSLLFILEYQFASCIVHRKRKILGMAAFGGQPVHTHVYTCDVRTCTGSLGSVNIHN